MSPLCQDFRAFFHALVAGVVERSGIVAMQQCVRLRCIGDVMSYALYGVNQASRCIDANARFHPEVPVVAIRRQVRLRIALAVRVLR